MSCLPDRPRSRLVVLGALALVLAVGLAGCGRKGPLEPPPSAAIEPPPPAPESAPASVVAWPPVDAGAPGVAGTARPANQPRDTVTSSAPAGKYSSPLDWLIN